MNQDLWERTDEQTDRLVEPLDQAMKSPQFEKIKEILSELSQILGNRYSVSVTCQVDIFDRERERSLPVLNHGLSTTEKGEVFRTFNDSSPQRYVVGGEIQVVPHDRCPKCWGEWDFKWESRACPHCDAALGKNCKVLLDSDVCPFCEKGKVSAANPKCDRCGYVIDPACVVWG